ncbi:MAG TPA: hypothetical protein VIH03_01075 [Nitrososphaerales archaeon]
MTDAKTRIKRRVMITLAVLPIIIAGFVLAGVFLGLYVNEAWGLGNSALMPIAFSLAGFFVSLIISYAAAKRVATV